MSAELAFLLVTAASLGFVHTLFGPDHYVPFIVMSKARGWSALRTAVITFLCGLGHILGSVVLGLVGVALGIAVAGLESVEAVRGGLAAWALIAFGLVYFVWGVRRAIRNRPHRHLHVHDDAPGDASSDHEHEHLHAGEHSHVHEEEGRVSITPWVLFTIFVLGPCEPLIPILMYPAAEGSFGGVLLVTLVFGATTIATMMTMVMALSLGINVLPIGRLERYTHALAGLTIFLCGGAIQFLGL